MVCRSPNVLLTREGVAKIADVGLMRAQVPSTGCARQLRCRPPLLCGPMFLSLLL